MSRLIWKRLGAEALAAFGEHLASRPEPERPRYGLVGVKASWWSRLGGGARPYVVLFVGDRVTLSKRSFRRHRELTRRDYRAGRLRRVAVRRGPLLESARFSFDDGWSVRVGGLPRGQAEPVAAWLGEGAGAFDPARLTREQLSNTALACQAMGLLPAGLLG